jgi:4-hydroxy-tetrahydrodipicolinate reductase
MKIALIGYGKMGKVIEKIAQARGNEIVARIDINGDDFSEVSNADVAIEFSQPEAAPANILKCIDYKIPVVCGTTGWLSKKSEIEKYCHQNNGSFFYASNFSLGVNIFFQLNEMLAKMMARHSYDVVIDETHHTEKKDAPSGTAITLAEGILKSITRKKEWVNHETREPSALVINSFRVDPAPGTHHIKYSSPADDIDITHTAHSREGFALGAVLVAEWMPGKKGVLTMQDFLQF